MASEALSAPSLTASVAESTAWSAAFFGFINSLLTGINSLINGLIGLICHRGFGLFDDFNHFLGRGGLFRLRLRSGFFFFAASDKSQSARHGQNKDVFHNLKSNHICRVEQAQSELFMVDKKPSQIARELITKKSL